MAKKKSSKQWIDRHVRDEYVKKSKVDGYRSRAAYKLLEIDRKDRVFENVRVVIDLGAAPGGWSQVAAAKVTSGVLLAVDLLQMEPIPGVQFIQGDFCDDLILDRLLSLTNGKSVDLVLSDMAPNITGMWAVDQPASMQLVELAFDLATETLAPAGVFVVKVFQGEGFDALVKDLRQRFGQVAIRKPKASRDESREVYIVAKGFRPNLA